MICECASCGASSTPTARYQDERYGAGRRVHNELKDGQRARCTSCGNVRSVGREKPQAEKQG